MLLIKNGYIVDPYTNLEQKMDILVGDDGRITKIEENIEGNCEIYDASGLYVSPGLIDVHVHFRTPGQTEKEDIESGSRAALAGGYTTVVCMANTKPLIDNEKTLQEILEENKKSPLNILQCATVTVGFDGETLVDFEKLHKLGAVGFTDDGVAIKSSKTTYEAFKQCKKLNVPISLHEEDRDLVYNAGVNFNSSFAKDYDLKGATSLSESSCIARDCEIAIDTGAVVNFQHISTKESVEIIKNAKLRGAKIFAEVTPHHIALTEDALHDFGTLAKMNPPLRKENDKKALIFGLVNDIIDIVATDHAPHTIDDKCLLFEDSPSGIIGLETAYSVCNTYLSSHLSQMKIIEKMSKNPAALYNLANKGIECGNICEIFVYNPFEKIIYDYFYSKSCNSPFREQSLTGKVYATIIKDKIVYRG